MEDAIRKAGVLTEALGWIRRFRGRYVVIKLGGSALEETEAVRGLLTDVLFMEAVGMRPILIHGGGKSINQAMSQAGIEPRWVAGRRYTDEATLNIATSTLAEEICPALVEEIARQGGQARPLHYGTQNCLIGERLTLPGEDGQPLDLGHVGQVVEVDHELLKSVCDAGEIPVLPSVALDRSGNRLNVNADTAAAALARLLPAQKLVFLSDVPGICTDRHDPSTLISHLEVARCRELISTGVIDSGMVPKVEAALEALAAGVRKVHIVDGRMPHSVLLEIYSDHGVGTEIVGSQPAAPPA
ncbi:MAG: acetylglutamate kinase [Planctomycetaceae bacterium]|nr:acetylglutamate kinase [Planctomycetaceae bacterium]